MKRKIWIVVSTLILVVTLSGCGNKIQEKADALNFKEEYESLNGKINENNGKQYRTISIPEDNPFVYKTADDIVNMINEKKSFVVYFGFDSCPWCRSVIPTLIETAKDLNIDKIYYVDVKEIRDTMALKETGELETTKKGTDGYYKLIELLDNVLTDYTLTNSDGDTISTGEKRIFAPNVVAVINGKAEKLESGISEKQDDGYMELTDEMKKDTYDMFKELLNLFIK